MSDCIIKLIPEDPFYVAEVHSLEQVVSVLEDSISCESVSLICEDAPFFIDCGENLESITCPCCGSDIDFGWWGDAMDKASERAFSSLDVVMPCCGNNTSLNDLRYYYDCGFSSWAIEIMNPENDIPDDQIRPVQEITGCRIKTIVAHI